MRNAVGFQNPTIPIVIDVSVGTSLDKKLEYTFEISSAQINKKAKTTL
jgi:hypothetical protein